MSPTGARGPPHTPAPPAWTDSRTGSPGDSLSAASAVGAIAYAIGAAGLVDEVLVGHLRVGAKRCRVYPDRRALGPPALPMVGVQGVDLVDLVRREVERCCLYPPVCL